MPIHGPCPIHTHPLCARLRDQLTHLRTRYRTRRWAHDPDNPNVLKQHNAEIVEATNHLVRTVIPAFVQRLQAFFETIFIESLKYLRRHSIP